MRLIKDFLRSIITILLLIILIAIMHISMTGTVSLDDFDNASFIHVATITTKEQEGVFQAAEWALYSWKPFPSEHSQKTLYDISLKGFVFSKETWPFLTENKVFVTSIKQA